MVRARAGRRRPRGSRRGRILRLVLLRVRRLERRRRRALRRKVRARHVRRSRDAVPARVLREVLGVRVHVGSSRPAQRPPRAVAVPAAVHCMSTPSADRSRGSRCTGCKWSIQCLRRRRRSRRQTPSCTRWCSRRVAVVAMVCIRSTARFKPPMRLFMEFFLLPYNFKLLVKLGSLALVSMGICTCSTV